MKYKDEEIVYIEYHNSKPFSVLTNKHSYDFEIDGNEIEEMMYYESGSGCGHDKKIDAPVFSAIAKDYCFFWLKKDYALVGKSNAKQIDNPLANPFLKAREVFDLKYCKFCDKWLDENWCEHITSNEEGDMIYSNGEDYE